MTQVKLKLITLLDQMRENILTGTFDTHELTFLYETVSEFFIEGHPDKGLLISNESIDQQTLFYLFLGWWICYLKNREDGDVE